MNRLFSLLLLAFWGFPAGAQQTSEVVESTEPACVQWVGGQLPNKARHNLGLRNAFFSEDFESVTTPALPAGWTTTGLAPIDFYTGIAGTDSGQANHGGFWGVTDHTVFAMTNDDDCPGCNKTADFLQLPSQNFTGQANMGISFAAYHDGRNGSEARLELSINGGANWTPVITIPARDNTWQYFNHIPLAGTDNEAGVLIRFAYDDNLAFTNGLAVDDVVIDERPDHDIALVHPYYNGTADSSGRAYYTAIPIRQAKQDTLDFGADLANRGTQIQPTVQLNVSVSGAGTFAGQATTSNFAPASTTALGLASAGFVATSLGSHSVSFQALTNFGDQSPVDNEVTHDFEVTPTQYARDNGNYTGFGMWFGQGNAYEIGNRFEVFSTDTLNSISVFFQEFTQPGSQVHIRLYDGTFSTVVAASLSNTLTAGAIGSWATFNMANPVALAPGQYVATVQTVSGDIFMAADPADDLAAPNTSWLRNGANFIPWTGAVPFIRVNLQPFNDPCPAALTSNVEAISCFGAVDGSIGLQPSGAIGPFSYNWSSGQTDSSITGLSAGTYTVTVTYGGSCSLTSTYFISEPDTLNPSVVSSTLEVCGNSGGAVLAQVSGGTAPLSFNWSSGDSTVASTNLSIGNYTVTVTDARGCTGIASGAVGGTPGVTANETVVEAACGASDGSITMNPQTGPGPYGFQWSHDGSLLGPTANNIAAGTYTVTVTDNNNCTASFLLFLDNAGAPSVSTNQVNDALCFGQASGGIDISVSGGTTPYTYAWNDAGATTTEDLTNVVAGTYRVTVTDGQGCIRQHLDSLGEPTQLEAIFFTSPALCYRDSNGAAGVSATGGTPGYSYLWSSGATTDTLDSIPGGTYVVTVTDQNGCTQTNNVIVGQPDSISVTAVITGEDTIQGGNGSIDITVTGGTPPYSYVWDGIFITEDRFNLNGGAYFLRVEDADGCVRDSVRFFVPYPTSVEAIANEPEVKLYPNPTNGLLHAVIPGATGGEPISFRLYDVRGRQLFAKTLSNHSGNSFTLDLSGPEPGIYLLQIQMERGSINRRILVQ